MKASLTLRENPRNPIVKAKIPISILGIPFRSGIQAGDYNELCISVSTAFRLGPLLKFCYRPNDSCRPFGFILRAGAGDFGSPSGSPMSMSAEFSFIGNNCHPRFLLHFKPRSGDFSVRRSVESPMIGFPSQNHDSLPIRNGVAAGEKMDLCWNQLFCNAYRVVSDGEVFATTSVPMNLTVVKLGWSLKFPPPVAATEAGGGWRAQTLLKELPYLVLRRIAIERVAGDERGKGQKRDLRGKGDDVVESRVGLKRELDLLNGENSLSKSGPIEDVKLANYK